ncbi:MAG TPA: hypothetical protein PLR32_04310 [candidate division Zixibacteria bacterium]|nr:hypothetical protein [candidate division Zixibacteria bacterium]MDD4916662.1 hypothetical protein [candidate division Zixibacteria bacterium]MDM7973220.1 hypothetical protein [candidate division Zixibacteria bacterium]HOD66012.1 hypothetical protein [candidate division Zixibacteria bacterium]HOZ07833.1 hypothetical protein [candidate division Zixibacteria bacterium]
MERGSMNYWLIGYEQKRSYQGNLLRALLSTALLFIGLGVLIRFAEPGAERRVSWSDRLLGGVAAETAAIQPTGRGGGAGGGQGASHAAPFLRGYVGPVVIIRDAPSTIRPAVAVLPGPSEPDPLPSPVPGEPGWGGDFAGQGDNPFGLPASEPYLPPVGNGFDGFDGLGGDGLNWAPAIRIRPAGWPMDADNVPRVDSGVVWLTLTIHADGRLSFVVDSAYPEARGFVPNVEWALIQSRVEPALQAGEPVATTFAMTYIVRRGGVESVVHSKTGYVRGFVAE